MEVIIWLMNRGFTDDDRKILDTGLVYADETIIEDTFVSTTLVNASSMTLAGADIGKTLSEYKVTPYYLLVIVSGNGVFLTPLFLRVKVRLNVLDQYLKTADVTKYYRVRLYYFMCPFLHYLPQSRLVYF